MAQQSKPEPISPELRKKKRIQRNESRAKERAESVDQQLKDIDDGIGFSSAKTLARYFGTTDKTIWLWAADPDNPFPKPKKIGANTTRWSNEEIKAHRENKYLGAV